MQFTVDLTEEEIDCVSRLLIAHISSTTDALRSRAAMQLPPPRVEEMWSDIRIAAVLAGRLSFHATRMEPA
jgi:hypothetical protein